MALLLHEEGFLDRARIYATDFNKHSPGYGAKGVYPAKQMARICGQLPVSRAATGYFPIITAPATN